MSATPNATNAEDDRNFSHARVRRLLAEVVIDVLGAALAAPAASLARGLEAAIDFGVEPDGASPALPAAACDNEKIVENIAELTKRPRPEARALLFAEELWPGSTVKAEMRRRGVAAYEWSEPLLELYRDGAVTFEQVSPLGELHVRWIGSDEGEIELTDEFDVDEYATEDIAGDQPQPPDDVPLDDATEIEHDHAS